MRAKARLGSTQELKENHMRRSILPIACGLMFVLTTAGSSLARPDGTTNPCKLVTAADAKVALGATPSKPQSLPAGRYQSCMYTAKSLRLVVLVRRISKSVFVKSANANPKPVVAVSGIGSSAYSVGGGASLLVWKNGTEAAFSIVGIGNSLKRDEQLA
ncbi:MAG TPA: hypothetical protein VLJ44_11080, partial [Gaiellaceae bacterium]|nr:hypothetical protein [Gaiellaceae bacterium]